jgi:hypothetical protein
MKKKNVISFTQNIDENLDDLDTIEQLIYILKNGDEQFVFKFALKNTIKNYYLILKNKNVLKNKNNKN